MESFTGQLSAFHHRCSSLMQCRHGITDGLSLIICANAYKLRWKSGADNSQQRPSVIVTGANRGIGLDIVTALVKHSDAFHVFGVCRTQTEALALSQLLAGLHQKGSLSTAVMDLRDEHSVQTGFKIITEQLARDHLQLVGLVNDASIIMVECLETMTTRDYRESLQTNVLGPHLLTQLCIPFLKQTRGRIVNIGSVAAWLYGPGFGVYCAGKAAWDAYSYILRMELKRFGIGVSVVDPGLIRTSAWDMACHSLLAYDKPGGTVPHGGDNTGGILTSPVPLDPHYRSMMRRVLLFARFARMVATPPCHVTHNVTHALTGRFPRVRYLAGWDAKVTALFMWMWGFYTYELILDVLAYIFA